MNYDYRKYLGKVHKKLKAREIPCIKAHTNALIAQYKITKNEKLMHEVFDLVLAYVFKLWETSQRTFCGYDLEEEMGEIYEEVVRSAELYDPATNVPFHLYFGRRLWSRFSHKRNRETYLTIEGKSVKRADLMDTVFHDNLCMMIEDLQVLNNNSNDVEARMILVLDTGGE